MRNYATKAEELGVIFSPQERQLYELRLASFFESMVSRKAKRQKGMSGGPRMSSLLWLKSIDHAMFVGMEKRILDFLLPKDWSLRCGPLVQRHRQPTQQTPSSSSSSSTASSSARLPLPALPPCLTLITDQQSTQMASANFLMYQLGMVMLHLRDPCHRAHNDCTLACKESGVWPVIVCTTVIYNLHFGPWASAAWFGTVKEGMTEMVVNMDPSNRLLGHFWNDILQDADIPTTEGQQHLAKVEFLKTLPDTKPLHNKGEQVALSRWFSWQHAARWWRPVWTVRLIGLIHVCLQRGDLKSARDVWSRQAPTLPAPDTEEVACGVASLPESTSKESPAAHEQDLSSLRKSCTNTLMLCIQLLADSNLKFKTNIILELTNPFAKQHADSLNRLKSSKSVVEYYADLAVGQWKTPFAEAIGLLSDSSLLRRCGFTMDLSRATHEDLHGLQCLYKSSPSSTSLEGHYYHCCTHETT